MVPTCVHKPPKISLCTYIHKLILIYIYTHIYSECRSQWPRVLRRRFAVAGLLGLWVVIPPEAWMSFSCEYCVLRGRGLCDELITRPEKSYRL
jgi:hypothetical protein